ncbi:MAG: hypothetical protein PHC54_05310 [Candidatus Omnitrophica bacterium]|nr:hypothetical protein [Candidatus Omnitrophota bacterium]MDD5592681.1 hypothetical protein [Candidatus Omnitrophota bacterium]
MKYTIEGFSQEIALRLGLDAIDLVLLRWMLDFYNTNRMEKHYWEEKEYFWVNYQTVIEDIPILGINNKMALRRRLRNIEQAKIVEFKVFQGAGNRTFYRFNGEILACLLSNKTRGGLDPNVKRVLTQMSRGSGLKCQDHIDPSTIDTSTIDKYIEGVNRFFNNPDQAWLTSLKKFYPKVNLEEELNKAHAWLISNTRPDKQKRDFKRFIVNWLNHPKSTQFANAPIISEEALNVRFGRIATKDMIKAFLRDIPRESWGQVERFLKRRWPQDSGRGFLEAQRELIEEGRKNQNQLAGLVATVIEKGGEGNGSKA